MTVKPHPPRCPTCRKIRAAHKAGTTGRNEIAKALGIAAASVTAHAKHAGITFDRAATAQAVAARSIDLRAMKQELIYLNYKRALDIRKRLDSGSYTYTVAVAGIGTQTVVDEWPPAADERNLGSAVELAERAALRAEATLPDATLNKARTMLDAIMVQIGLDADA